MLTWNGEREIVDENLYYRAIKKDEADHSRRDQTHGLPPSRLLNVSSSLPAPENETPSSESTTEQKEAEEKKQDVAPTTVPPFLFRNANGLLNMTRQHNVRCTFASSLLKDYY